MVASPEIISLVEYQRTALPASALSQEAGTTLWQQYGAQERVFDVTFPSPRTGGQWELTSLGWIGYIPLLPELHFWLQPRVPLGNLFRMLAYAYHLEEICFLPGLAPAESIREFYEQMAQLLAERVLARSRRGLYQAYLPRDEALPYVRGQLSMPRRRPWQPQLQCRYEEQTDDLPENQILAWTLRRIAQSGLCREPVQGIVRRAYRSLGAISTPIFSTQEVTNRVYNRLNEDYAPLHALCHFFLDHSGPGHHAGETKMVPFLVNMARLYEQFVAAWLRRHLPAPYRLQVQERAHAGGAAGTLTFVIDMVLYEATDVARFVLDTKYKEEITTADVQQAVTYAQLRHCSEAILVYPHPLRRGLDVHIGDVRVRALTFALDDDLEAQGQAFLSALALPA